MSLLTNSFGPVSGVHLKVFQKKSIFLELFFYLIFFTKVIVDETVSHLSDLCTDTER